MEALDRMGKTKNPKLLKRTLNISVTPEVRATLTSAAELQGISASLLAEKIFHKFFAENHSIGSLFELP